MHCFALALCGFSPLCDPSRAMRESSDRPPPVSTSPVAFTVDPQGGSPPDSTPRCSEVAVRRARTLAHVPHAPLRVRGAPLARWTQGCLYVSRAAAQGWGPTPSPVDIPPTRRCGWDPRPLGSSRNRQCHSRLYTRTPAWSATLTTYKMTLYIAKKPCSDRPLSTRGSHRRLLPSPR